MYTRNLLLVAASAIVVSCGVLPLDGRANTCDINDYLAKDHACGDPDQQRAVVGPNMCLQLSTSVKNPSNTDKVLSGGYTIHCHNTASVVNGAGQTCSYPCNMCSQCAGHASKRDDLVEEIDETDGHNRTAASNFTEGYFEA